MEFTFTLTKVEANLVLKSLATLPLGESLVVFNKIQLQGQEQMKCSSVGQEQMKCSSVGPVQENITEK